MNASHIVGDPRHPFGELNPMMDLLFFFVFYYPQAANNGRVVSSKVITAGPFWRRNSRASYYILVTPTQ